MAWQPIDTAPKPTEDELYTPILVWNGEQVGEAVCEITCDWDKEDMPEVHKWAWTHHSTCSCCHQYMDPQPTKWQPLPTPPEE